MKTLHGEKKGHKKQKMHRGVPVRTRFADGNGFPRKIGDTKSIKSSKRVPGRERSSDGNRYPRKKRDTKRKKVASVSLEEIDIQSETVSRGRKGTQRGKKQQVCPRKNAVYHNNSFSQPTPFDNLLLFTR